MKNTITIIFLGLCLTGCSPFKGDKIVITKEYIINDNWVNSHNGITVERMKIKPDSSLNILAPNFDSGGTNNWNVINKLELDSSFVYSYNVGSTYDSSLSLSKSPDKKLYFNKPNKSLWVKGLFSGDTIKTLGSLQNDTWYRFSKLTPITKFYVFIYVDDSGKVHRFDQDLSNY